MPSPPGAIATACAPPGPSHPDCARDAPLCGLPPAVQCRLAVDGGLAWVAHAGDRAGVECTLARLSGQERLVKRQIIGLALATGGVAVAVAERGLDWQGHGAALVGDGLILMAALCGAAYEVLVKRISGRYSALTVT